MSTIPTSKVEDSVAKVNNEVAVGENLGFQRKWWVFERVMWLIFATIVLLDLAGVFGRGWLANARIQTNDRTMDIRYERVERYNSPSILNVQFGANAIHNGRVQLWVNERVVKELGNQRVVPQPVSSVIGDDGITYTFEASFPPASVQFALQPSTVGIFPLELRIPGAQMITTKIVVMP